MAVNKPPAKRGRPKSAQTLEREKIEAWLKNPPAHIRLLTKKERQLLKDSFEASEKLRQNLLAGHSPLIPHSLIYDLESIGHELLEGYEQAILNKYEEYKNKDVEFIYISIDSDIKRWEVASKKENLKNLKNNFLSINYPKANLYQELIMKTIPRFIIYDKKGNLVNSNAPNPNSKEIKDELDKYLNQ